MMRRVNFKRSMSLFLASIMIASTFSSTAFAVEGNAGTVPTEITTPAPTQEPTPEPTAEPTPEATPAPTAEPTPEATPAPTAEPTPEATPTNEPTATPEATPTNEPTAEPSPSEIPAENALMQMSLFDEDASFRASAPAPVEYTIDLHFPDFKKYPDIQEYDINDASKYNPSYIGEDIDIAFVHLENSNGITLFSDDNDNRNSNGGNDISLWLTDTQTNLSAHTKDGYAWFVYQDASGNQGVEKTAGTTRVPSAIANNGASGNINFGPVSTTNKTLHFYYEKVTINTVPNEEKITLSYDTNAPTASTDNTGLINPAPQTLTITDPTTAREIVATGTPGTIAGYEFKGWATTSTATVVEYAVGSTVTFAAGVDTIILYAVWEKTNGINPPVESAELVVIEKEYTGTAQTIRAQDIIDAQHNAGYWPTTMSIQLFTKAANGEYTRITSLSSDTLINVDDTKDEKGTLVETVYMLPLNTDPSKMEYAEVSVNIKITPADVEVYGPIIEVDEDQTPDQALLVAGYTYSNGVTVTDSDKASFDTTLAYPTTPNPLTKGTYDITVTAANTNTNFNVTTKNGTLTVREVYGITYEGLVSTDTFGTGTSPVTSNPNTLTYSLARPLATLINPNNRVDAEFIGWTVDFEDERFADITTPSMALDIADDVTGKITITANWKALKASYTVYHMLENLDGTYAHATDDDANPNQDGVEKFDGMIGETVPYSDTVVHTYEGFTHEATDFKTGKVLADGSLEVFYYYNRAVYEITFNFDVNEADYVGSNNGKITLKVKHGGKIEVPTLVMKPGYEFKGWLEPLVTENITSNASYTANIELIQYEIKYNGLKDIVEDKNTLNNKEYNVETASFELNNPSKIGYDFLGWKLKKVDGVKQTGETANLSTTVDPSTQLADLVYVAKWEKASYTNTFATPEAENQVTTYNASAQYFDVNELVLDTRLVADLISADLANSEADIRTLATVTYKQNKTDVANPVNAGVYDVTITLPHPSGNGNVKTTATLTINKAQLTWTQGTVEDKVYDATNDATVLTAPTLTGFLGTDEADVTVSVKEGKVNFNNATAKDDKNVEAKNYKVTISGLQAGNYEVPTAQPTFARATITQKPITITANSMARDYNYLKTEAHEVGYTVSANSLIAGHTEIVTLTGAVYYAGDRTASVVSDVVINNANGKDVTANYDITTVNGELRIWDTTAPAPAPGPVDPVDPIDPIDPVDPVDPVTEIEETDVPEAPAPEVEIEETNVPQAPALEVEIEDTEAPTSMFNGAWALINLIFTVLTGLMSVVLLVTYFGKKKHEDEEDEEGRAINKKGFMRLLSLIPAIGAVVVFILTEDMSLPMQYVDQWTWIMAVIALVQLVVVFFSKKTTEDEDEDNSAATV